MNYCKAKLGLQKTHIDMNQEQRDFAIMLLAQAGYDAFTESHHMKAYAINNEFGVIAISLGQDIQESLDNACDDNKLNSQLMSDSDYAEYDSKGWHDSYILLGNASEPFWSEYLGCTEIKFS